MIMILEVHKLLKDSNLRNVNASINIHLTSYHNTTQNIFQQQLHF